MLPNYYYSYPLSLMNLLHVSKASSSACCHITFIFVLIFGADPLANITRHEKPGCRESAAKPKPCLYQFISTAWNNHEEFVQFLWCLITPETHVLVCTVGEPLNTTVLERHMFFRLKSQTGVLQRQVLYGCLKRLHTGFDYDSHDYLPLYYPLTCIW